MKAARKQRKNPEKRAQPPKKGKSAKGRKLPVGSGLLSLERRERKFSPGGKRAPRPASGVPALTPSPEEPKKSTQATKKSFEHFRELLSDSIKLSGKHSKKFFHPIIGKGGLPAALQLLLQQTSEEHGIKCSLKVSADFSSKSSRVSLHLFCIAREAISNAVIHGKPKSITIHLTPSPKHIKMRIRNDGRPFQEANLAEKHGKGLMGIELRVHLMGGTWVIHTPRKQTEVLVEVPVETKTKKAPVKGTDAGKSSSPKQLKKLTKSFSLQEQRVYLLLSQGFKHGEIAKAMGVGYKTVETYLTRMKEKLNLCSTRALALHAVQHT